MVNGEFKTPPIQIIEWWDSFAIEDEWYEVGTKHPPRHIVSSGYVVGEDEHYVYLASTFDPTSGNYSVAIAIYKPCIVNKTPLASAGYL